jgi:hypothetical protein
METVWVNFSTPQRKKAVNCWIYLGIHMSEIHNCVALLQAYSGVVMKLIWLSVSDVGLGLWKNHKRVPMIFL